MVNMSFNPLHVGYYSKNMPVVELLYVSMVALITISTLQASQQKASNTSRKSSHLKYDRKS